MSSTIMKNLHFSAGVSRDSMFLCNGLEVV